jgi:hypothetical protein
MLKGVENASLPDDIRYLYLREIHEPRDNSLRIVIQEAGVSDMKVGSQMEANGQFSQAVRDAGILDDARAIESTETSRTFVLYWKHYAAYLVTEECVGSVGNYSDEVYTGKLLRHYLKSHFLDHLARDTGGHMGPLQHYKLICLNHLVDVASEEPPEIQLNSDESQTRDSIQ